jgi:hypothetical protein
VTEEASVNLMKIRSGKTKICVAVIISCECTIENGRTMKSVNVTSSGSAEMLTKM